MTDMLGTATYSPEDNKLRFTPYSRLPKEDYNRIRSAGFIWAPKQEIFVAPMWTPDREDLLIEWCGEIEDEDKSLVERAEERAERFEDYSDKRAHDADHARAAVSAITDGIPLGQPILVGHHSEKHARRDAEKIENGMRRAVKLWETSKYWEQRAKAAVRHAKYLERPDVRARRIKKIEADQRKQQRTVDEAARFIKAWSKEGLTMEQAIQIANFDHGYWDYNFPFKRETGEVYHHGPCSYWDALSRQNVPLEDVIKKAISGNQSIIERSQRWLTHYENRLAYERGMFESDGGTVADKTGPEKGGACRCWCNPGWSFITKVNKVSVTVLDNWGNGGADFTRTVPFDKLAGVMTKAQVDAARDAGRLVGETARSFLLADAPAPAPRQQPAADPKAEEMKAMKETLEAGVKVVSAPQLFPTPVSLAKRMGDLAFETWGVQICAEMNDKMRILEPSAGTGSILAIIREHLAKPESCLCELVAVEINPGLAAQLRYFGYEDVHCADFLQCNGDLGKFDRILMNPPFERGSDIEHIKHAIEFLNPGGRLVAICANGPRQQKELQPLCDQWIDLPAGSFESQGTGVNTAMIVINK